MISSIDILIIICYFLLIIFIGIKAGKKESSIDDYFLGSRKMPWWAVLISIYATALSALTFIGVPGAAFKGDYVYLQLAFGDFFGRFIIAYLLLTAYYKNKVYTVYEFLFKRFGIKTQLSSMLFFIITRLLASAVRLAGCAIAISVIFDISLPLSIIIITLIALIYTFLGGIKAVIYTDIIQFCLFIIAALVSIGVILYYLPDGLNDYLKIGLKFNKFKIFHFSLSKSSIDYIFNFSNPYSFVAGFLFGCFTTIAALGTDQDLAQRMLTCEKVKQSQVALIGTAILNFPVTFLFLSVGTALFVYYKVFPDEMVAQFIALNQTDKIFPYFIKTSLAAGLKGLLISGLLAASMSSLDSALNALSSSFYIDFIKPVFKNIKSDPVKLSKIFVIIFAVILALLAIIFVKTDSILWLGFRIVGYTYGAMLGVFLLGTLTKNKGNDKYNFLIMILSVLIVIFFTSDNLYFNFFNNIRESLFNILHIKKIAWSWSIIIGCLFTFFSGLFATTKKGIKLK